MKCNKCNHILPDDSEFCQYCGNKITGFLVSKKIEGASDNMENPSGKNGLNVLMAAQVKATREAYDANRQNQPYNENDSDFGLVPEKPIYTLARKSVDGETEYLSKLRTPKGEKVKWNRRGSLSVEGINGLIDMYDIYLMSGQKYTTIYINMYGAKASTKMPVGFGVQKAQPINKAKKEKKSKLDIINIFVLILPLILSIAGLSICYSYTEGLYVAVLCCGIIAIILKTLNVTKFKNNTIITVFTVCTLLIMLIPCLTEDLWDEDEVIAAFILIPTIYVWICELCKFINVVIEKYHASQCYKMRCYKKINLINEYREKGVITEEEFEKAREQIVSKIH